MMNGNVATYSGTYMPHKTPDKNNLRLDLNLMNLNNTMTNSSLTPSTPNGKIKVYTNNLTSNVTKVANQSKNQINNSINEWKRCKLDDDECINLESVLQTFNSSISEEQAWTICYGYINCIKRLIRKGFKFKKEQIKLNNNLNQNNFIFLHKDGYVHEKTILLYNDNNLEFNEQELLIKLGLALFDALDYKKDSNEELLISDELENLIGKITLEELDDNIEFTFTIDEVYEICCSRKGNQTEDKIDDYYSNICKTLVIETIELSTFLQTIYEGTQLRDKMFNKTTNKQDCVDSYQNNMKLSNDEPLKLHLSVWARLWMQVLEEFRNGNHKLKKVELIDKNLNNTNLDQMNAHALIMEYIRSRPALMPANNRKLGPLLKPSPQSLREQIHDSIRRQDHKLKPVHLNPRSFSPIVGKVVDNETKKKFESNSENSSPMIRRKLVKADIDFIDWDNSDEFCGKNIKYSSLF